MARVNSNLVKVGLSTASIANHTIGVEKLKFGSIIQSRTMTSDQQVITGLDTIRPETAFTQVYKNGILLDSSDYTINSATQITLTIGADINDEITIRSLIDNAAPPLARVANNTITTNKIADGVITANKIADGVITANKIHSVDSSKIPSNILYNGQSTIHDTQGDVRTASVTVVTSTPFTIPSGSSGQIFRLQTGSGTLNFNAANFNQGDIVTVVDITGSTKTLSFDDGFFAVRTVGDSTNYQNNTLTLAAHGVTTLIAISDTRLMVNGNVS